MTRQEEDELARAVLGIVRRIERAVKLEPARVECPGYDQLVREGRLAG